MLKQNKFSIHQAGADVAELQRQKERYRRFTDLHGIMHQTSKIRFGKNLLFCINLMMMIYFGLDISFELVNNYYSAYCFWIITINILTSWYATTLQKENLAFNKNTSTYRSQRILTASPWSYGSYLESSKWCFVPIFLFFINYWFGWKYSSPLGKNRKSNYSKKMHFYISKMSIFFKGVF